MTTSTISHVTASCPHCGTRNQVSGDGGAYGLVVHCSKCHAPLGKLAMLSDSGKEEAAPEPGQL